MKTNSSRSPIEFKTQTSRRDFLGTAAIASALLALPEKLKAADKSGREATAGKPVTGIEMAASVPVISGVPLGGIGAGFLELRPDGCFYEWQIFNHGGWSGAGGSALGFEPPRGPQLLRFMLWTGKNTGEMPQLRRLYTRTDENDLYSRAYIHDIESIDFDPYFPMTSLRYNDSSLPIRVSATVFSPFIPGKARDSATPGFHFVFTLENVSKEPFEASVISLLDNPIVPDLAQRKLKNTLRHAPQTTALHMETEATPENMSRAGSLCLSVTGGEHSWISGMPQSYAWTGARWQRGPGGGGRGRGGATTDLQLVKELFRTGRLPKTEMQRDLASGEFKLTAEEIDSLNHDDVDKWLQKVSGDVLVKRVIDENLVVNPKAFDTDDLKKAFLKEVARNVASQAAARAAAAGAAAGGAPGATDAGRSGRGGGPAGPTDLGWGSGALGSTVRLAPGERVELRFALSWFFPHHLSRRGEDMGHMYGNWFENALGVNDYLVSNYAAHRQATDAFARSMAETTLGKELSFAWSSQLGTAVKGTWWIKDGSYAMWEGMGCCGLSTTDVDYQGSFPIVALFPDLKLEQTRRSAKFQNDRGQIPHNFASDLHRVDNSFARVDMNPQFVMMVCRDYLWTGDMAFLEALWPAVVKAMDYTGSLDSNDDALPDQRTNLQTYDNWSMRGAPAYICSLWIGALKAAVRIATDLKKPDDAQRWSNLLDKASQNFDRIIFNGEYYSLFVDGESRSEVCMSDQISGEWFSHLIGLPTTVSEKNLSSAVNHILKNNFNPEFGLHNASAPRGGADALTASNFQASGVWSGIEFAVASFLMDHGRYEDGVKIVQAVYRRYLRAGRPWNHVECGDHYSRAMSSWATLLAATGFKPDIASQSLTIAPTAPGDFQAPWAMASGFGRISRRRQSLTITCEYGKLPLRTVKVNLASSSPTVRIGGRSVSARTVRQGNLIVIELAQPAAISEGESCTIG